MLVVAAGFADFVLGVHIVAVVIGFGVTFAYPVLYAVVRQTDPRALAALHRAQIAVGQRITGPALGGIVLTGLYLAARDHAFGQLWVLWAIAAAIALGLIGALVIRPTAASLLEFAERDAVADTASSPSLSSEYLAHARRMTAAGAGTSLIVLLTVIDMAVKPAG